ncbi:MAG: autotransporter domain-containing protein [Hyphomicrobiales bacterium]
MILILDRLSFTTAANTPNQRAVAGALDSSPPPTRCSGRAEPDRLGRPASLTRCGEIHATVAGTLADDSRYVREAILGRLMQANYANAGNAQVVSRCGPQSPDRLSAMALGYDDKSLGAPAPSPLAFWTRAYGAWGDFDGDGNAATADRNLGGFVSGMDASIGGSWRVGLATGASFASVDVDARYSSAEVDSFNLGGYAGGMVGPFALRGGGAWAWNDIDTNRAVIFPGFFERQASYDAATGQLFGEIAYPTTMWGLALEPFGGIATSQSIPTASRSMAAHLHP